MTTIRQHAEYATLINVFTVEPDRAKQLADLLSRSTDEVMRHLPGFRSANSISAPTARASSTTRSGTVRRHLRR